MTHRSIGLALALACSLFAATGANSVSVRAAEDNAAEIPGTLWSGGRANGSVGGSSYDRVWRLVLTEARVALVQLRGEAGAELGLYLFDGSATSVVSGTPIKQSAQPGGSQGFAAPLAAGTYYLDVNGRNEERAYAFTLTVALILDPTPPFLSLDIADGAGRVSSATVSVAVNAIESLSGLEEMRMRVDAGEWGAWQPFARTAQATFAETEGEHRVEMQVTNGAGLVSATASDTVILDLTAPVGSLLSPSLSSLVSVSRPTIRYQFTEPLRRSSWGGSAISIQDASGNVIRGTGSYDPETQIGTYSVAEALTPGVEYVVQGGSARDRAGNSIVVEPWVLSYRLRPRIIVGQAKLTAVGSTPARIVYETTALPAGAVLLLERLTSEAGDGTWEPAGETRVGSGGGPQSVSIQPPESGIYQLRYLGSAMRWPAVSARIRVTLAPRIVVLGSREIRTVAVGAAQVVSFQVLPSAVTDLTLVRSRCTASFTRCEAVERIPVMPNADGVVSYAWTPTAGAWTLRLRTPSTAEHREARSAPVKYAVR
jgi:hypothetical protein